VRKAYGLLVASYHALSKCDDAERVCAAGLRLFPDDPELMFRSGILAQNRGKLEEAERAYKVCLNPNDGSRRYFGSIDEGITGFKAQHNLAVVYGEMHRFDRAESEWRDILDKRPNYRPALRGLLDALSRQNRTDEAKRHAEQEYVEPALRAEGALWRAKAAKQSGDLTAARQAFHSIVAEFSDDVVSLREAAEFLFWHDEPSETYKVLRHLVQRCPEDASAHFNLGTVCIRLGDFGRAADAFRESLKFRPAWPATLNQLAFVLEKLAGRHARASIGT
jgi:tetratricopeptide (TPR) repeat protein